MSLIIQCRGISTSYGERCLFRSLDWEIRSEDRIGLVGSNGSGKTTLIGIAAGLKEPDEGWIKHFPPGLKIGYLTQGGDSLIIGGSHPVNPAHSKSQLIRYGRILKVSRLNQEESLQPTCSGGERTRLGLARLWAESPQLMVLDEPTNSLDSSGIEWLVEAVGKLDTALIVVSHDRYFLDRTVNKTAALENGRLMEIDGNYSHYRAVRRQQQASQMQAWEQQEKETERLNESIARLKGWSDQAHRDSRRKALENSGRKEHYRAKAKKKDRAVHSQIQRLEKMRQEGMERPLTERKVRFQTGDSRQHGSRMLAASDLAKSFAGKALFQSSSFWINRGDRVGIVGPNGCGKTTLLNIIMNQDTATGGDLYVSPTADIAYVGQNQPVDDRTTLRERLALLDRTSRGLMMTVLARLNIGQGHMDYPEGLLSYGERTRIAIATALAGPCNFIILDEPGNHLDLPALEALEAALDDYPGTLLLVSHDRYLMDRLCTRLLVFDSQRIKTFEGPLEEYLSQPAAIERELKPFSLSAAERQEQLLLLDTQMSWVLGQLAKLQPEDPEYAQMDAEYQRLRQNKIAILSK